MCQIRAASIDMPALTKSFIGTHRLRRACTGALVVSCLAALESAAEDRFDSSFLRRFDNSDAALTLDLTALSESTTIAAGVYPVSVSLNGSPLGQKTLQFVATSSSSSLSACLSEEFLRSLGALLEQTTTTSCVDIASAIPGAFQQFDSHTLTLTLSIPQASMQRTPHGLIEEREWDRGINAGMLNYQLNTARGRRSGQGATSQSNLYLQAGVNIAGWRLRSNSSLHQGTDTPSRWQRSNTYAQRDIGRQWGALTLGEHFTPGNVFDSVPYRGIQLSSDMAMLPESMQGYAPVVRGVAESQAKVEVRQNGYSLFSTFVPPGPFVIDNLTAAGGSGDLEVIVTEADGRQRSFIQPYATLGNMLREGVWRHSVTLGQYHAAEGDASPGFAEATLAYGLPWDLTVYGGMQASGFYQAAQAGMGISLGQLGAVSLDVTQARAENPNDATDSGQSYGWRYGKSFATGTSVRFAGYRYSTRGYRDFSEAVWQQSPAPSQRGTKRNRIEASLSQSTPRGSIYLGVYQQTYWNSDARDQQLQIGINTHWRGINYGLYASKSLTEGYRSDQQVSLTISLPLGDSASGTYSATHNGNGTAHRSSVTGSLGSGNVWRYGLNASRAEQGEQAGSVSLNHRAPFAVLGTTVSAGANYRQATFSASGSMLAHADGVEWGHTLGETLALVDVSGVADVGIQNAPGTHTNSRGYALVPYLTPYRRNRIALDTEHLGMEVDIDNGVTQAIPTRGAIVKARFNASRTRKIIAIVRLADGKQLPFGSQVTDAQARLVGVVGPGGQVLLAVPETAVALQAKWSQGVEGQCTVEVAALPSADLQGISHQKLVCEKSTELSNRVQDLQLPTHEAAT